MIEYTQGNVEEKKFMKLAFNLAKKAAGKTSPNPLVGAVIVKDGKVLACGFHKKAGMPHAEIEAINSCKNKKDLIGSTLYVTLEPCCIFGKTPPCTNAIIESGISCVVAAAVDPNPKISGKGLEQLDSAGIKTKVGVLEEMAKKQNEVFFKHIIKGEPFITSKIAISLDGKTAAKTGDSKWITSEKSRNLVKKLRFEHDCVLTGINTVMCDNPLLLPFFKQKIDSFLKLEKKYYRVILDSKLSISSDSNIVKTSEFINTIIFTSEILKSQSEISKSKSEFEKFKKNNNFFGFFNKKKFLESKNIKVIPVPSYKDLKSDKLFLDLKTILHILYKDFEITSVFLESGKTLFTEFLKSNLIDKFIFFVAPKLIGNDSPYGIAENLNILKVNDAINLKIDKVQKIGNANCKDLFIIAYKT